MEKISNENNAILFSCYTSKSRAAENFVQDHTISYVQSGTLEFQLSGAKISYGEGEAFFVKRNLLAKTIKIPGKNGEFNSISVHFRQETLKEIGLANDFRKGPEPYRGQPIVSLRNDRLLKNYFESLNVYEQEVPANSLIRLKVEEGLLLLTSRQSELKDVLFDFNKPGKIDLEEFMIKHFRFNVNMKRFAHLTGRSVATFKRDFEKIFQVSPNRWIQQKRLEEAYFLIKEKGRKPSEVYLEVGFEDLSHFSFAFKKNFGVAPSYI